jgi:hypothetical protein
MARCWSDSVPVADGRQVPGTLRAVLEGSPGPQHQPRHAARAGGFGAASGVGGGLVRRARGDSALTP